MSCMLLLCLSATFFFGEDLPEAPEASKVEPAQEVIPQAASVLTWLDAVKKGDKELLKTVFSERMQKELEDVGWDKVTKLYQEVFTKEFGDYDLSDFKFAFTGDDKQGLVAIGFKGKTLPGLRVVKENDAWKVNER